MAVTIRGSSEQRTFPIEKWYGLNEAPDGDTKLRLGDAAICRNWKITQDGNLQRRPGNSMINGLLQGYKISISQDAQVVRTDRGASSTLTLYPEIYASYDGFPTVTGEPEKVSHSTFSNYAGWYWRCGTYFTYQLTACFYNSESDTYTWYGYAVSCVPDTENPDYAVRGMWSGELDGKEYVLAVCNGKLWNIYDADTLEWVKREIGDIDTDGRVSFFPFDGKVYILTGKEYYEFDGTFYKPVQGYRPLISISNVPGGGGQLLEEVNKLNGMRRLWFSPDGTSTEFVLPEKDLISIDYVMDNATGAYMSPDDYSVDPLSGKVTFGTAPVAGTNTVEIGYTAAATFRQQVCRMRFAELFLGATDNAVFLYGDGSNEAFYSSVDYNGNPRADYFPDLNEVAVGDMNTPITGMIRHQSRLIVFKKDSAWSISYGTITLEDGNMQYGFYVSTVNRNLGNSAMGMVQLIQNDPWTVHGKQLYQWKSNSYYSSNISADERTARRISDKIYATLGSYDTSKVYTFDDNDNQEYYICYNGQALVCNYQVQAWYQYTDFDAVCMCKLGNYLIFGTSDGKAECLSYRYKSSDGLPIDSYWESGSMDFGRPYQRKYSAELWVGLKPESAGAVTVTVQTDKKSEYTEKTVDSDLFSFSSMNFRRFTFKTNRKPQVRKLKIKAKKFVYYKLIFKTNEADTAATILTADIRVRFTGDAK